MFVRQQRSAARDNVQIQSPIPYIVGRVVSLAKQDNNVAMDTAVLRASSGAEIGVSMSRMTKRTVADVDVNAPLNAKRGSVVAMQGSFVTDSK